MSIDKYAAPVPTVAIGRRPGAAAPEPVQPGAGPAGRLAMFGYSFLMVLLVAYGWLIFGLLIASIVLVVVWIGLPMLLGTLLLLRHYTRIHRQVSGRVLGVPIAPPYRPAVPGGVFVKLRMRLTDPATFRDAIFLLEALSLGFALYLTALIAFPILPIGWWGSPFLLRLQASVTRMLAGPTGEKELEQRIGQLETSRAATVDHSAAELRRIERDLHDGAQARLVALGMNLGLAEELMRRDPDAAAELIAEARSSSSTALSELRNLVRGIHPPVLADRGLVGGIEALALTHAGPVDVDVQIPDGRPPRSSPRSTSRSRRPSPTPRNTLVGRRYGYGAGTTTGGCGSPSPTTGTVGPSSIRRAGWPVWNNGWPPSTAASRWPRHSAPARW